MDDKLKTYKNSPLWKQAVEAKTKEAINLLYASALCWFDEPQQEIASVVLAYFNGKPKSELREFYMALGRYLEHSTPQIDHIYGCSIENAEMCKRFAEEEVEKLVKAQLLQSSNDTDNTKGNTNRSTEQHKQLNFFQRFLGL